jgi:histidine triad (HIT) family protein
MASVFTKVLRGEIPGKIVFEDELCFALVDIKPEAPKHFLIVPKKEITSVGAAAADDKAVLGHLLLVAADLARRHGVAETGYRLITNIGADAGQTVPHLHIHLLGGRALNWPPG